MPCAGRHDDAAVAGRAQRAPPRPGRARESRGRSEPPRHAACRHWFREIRAPPEIEALARSVEDREPECGRPEPALVQAIVTGTSPTLLALDREEVMT
jgi:hypothetical protein